MFDLPILEYAYTDLEPYIDAKTMELHHSKHHQTYINNLKDALSKHPEITVDSLEELITTLDRFPSDIASAVRNNGGGHYNHTLFWKCLSPAGKTEPGKLTLEYLIKDLHSFEEFKESFSKAALTRFGSGWAWLVLNNKKKVEIISTANQDTPASNGETPLLTIDVWEHSYYLKYQNRRAEYIENWWNVVNWDFVESQLSKAL